MVIVKLWGGLGNQLFQYAFGYKLAKSVNEKLILDVGYYEKNKLRKPVIFNYNLIYDHQIKTSDRKLIVKFLNNKFVNRLIRIPSICDLRIGNNYRYLKETRYKYTKYFEAYKHKNVYLDGYWQSPNYISEIRDEIIEIFTLNPEKISKKFSETANKIKTSKYISLHARRGDYLKNQKSISPLLRPLQSAYFKTAISEAIKEFPDSKFLVFSDDIEWVKREFSEYFNIFEFVEGFTDYEELLLMSFCQNNIISNSTFSWWAAYLNKNNKKIVWAPESGFGNKDTLPAEWRTISVQF